MLPFHQASPGASMEGLARGKPSVQRARPPETFWKVYKEKNLVHLLPSLRTALQQVPTGALITSIRFCTDCCGELCRMRYLLSSYLQPELNKHLSFCTKERKSSFSICSPSTSPQLYSHVASQRLTLQQLSREADVTGTGLVRYWWCWPMSGRAPHGLLE